MFTRRKHQKAAEAAVACSVQRSSKGFTLLELVLAITLLSMLTGTLFMIVQGSVKAAVEIENVQRENDQVNRFITLCRQTFQSLPSTAILSLSATGQGTTVHQELTISGMSECFPFGYSPISYEDTILTLRPDAIATQKSTSGQALYYLGLSREDLIPKDPNSRGAGVIQSSGEGVAAPDEQGRYWMPLLPDVVSLMWRVYQESDDTWVEEWDSATLPPLVEMNLVIKDRTVPIRLVFAVPGVKAAASSGTTGLAGGGTGQGGQTSTAGAPGNGNQQGAQQPGQGGQGQGQGGGRGEGGGGPGGGQGGGGQGGQGGQGGGGRGPGGGGFGGGQRGGGQNSSGGAQPGGGGQGSTQGGSR